VLDRALYLERNDPQAAEAVLKRLRGTDDVGDELKILCDEQKANEHVKHLTIKQVSASLLYRVEKIPQTTCNEQIRDLKKSNIFLEKILLTIFENGVQCIWHNCVHEEEARALVPPDKMPVIFVNIFLTYLGHQ